MDRPPYSEPSQISLAQTGKLVEKMRPMSTLRAPVTNTRVGYLYPHYDANEVRLIPNQRVAILE